MSEGGEIPGRRKSRKVILTSLVLNEQRKPTVFLQRVKDLKVIQFQKIDQNRIGYDGYAKSQSLTLTKCQQNNIV